eukprot:CAMPEP_0174265734 /NCGR_PEP_ID=MMETSP0439-20130205/27667_1 /TAXON_ID=0 /ORGANISM="Stereomyxa ramosa, Strain Chinc5" /LENGTH=217 /DNA_ID=CAMNT_0015352341 /DNA_START=119 /DNA_END=773 /DNA_ORIENTATION=-
MMLREEGTLNSLHRYFFFLHNHLMGLEDSTESETSNLVPVEQLDKPSLLGTDLSQDIQTKTACSFVEPDFSVYRLIKERECGGWGSKRPGKRATPTYPGPFNGKSKAHITQRFINFESSRIPNTLSSESEDEDYYDDNGVVYDDDYDDDYEDDPCDESTDDDDDEDEDEDDDDNNNNQDGATTNNKHDHMEACEDEREASAAKKKKEQKKNEIEKDQ